MTEREACALLKARFEKAGYRIAENVGFDEGGVAFDIDGFDAEQRVGYEYVTDEAGDSWDVGGEVIAALDEQARRTPTSSSTRRSPSMPASSARSPIGPPGRRGQPKKKPAAKKPKAKAKAR